MQIISFVRIPIMTFSPQDIKKIIKEDTVIITVKDCIQEVNALQKPDKIILVKPEEHYQLEGISFSTTYAYNQTKSFHPKEKGWVGYLNFVRWNNLFCSRGYR